MLYKRKRVRFVELTKSEYNASIKHLGNAFYFCSDTRELYKGDVGIISSFFPRPFLKEDICVSDLHNFLGTYDVPEQIYIYNPNTEPATGIVIPSGSIVSISETLNGSNSVIRVTGIFATEKGTDLRAWEFSSNARVSITFDDLRNLTTSIEVVSQLPVNPVMGVLYILCEANDMYNLKTYTFDGTKLVRHENSDFEVFVTNSIRKYIESFDYATKTELADGLATKQDVLEAGYGISIVGNIISTNLGAVLTFKGIKDTIDELPDTGNKVGDVWYVHEDSSEHVWVEEDGEGKWECLGPIIDLSPYATIAYVDAEIEAEQALRESAEAALQAAIEAETAARTTAVAGVHQEVVDEAAARTSADTALGDQITAESQARVQADSDLSDAIGAETAARTSADETLGQSIEAVDSKLDEAVDDLEAVDAQLDQNIQDVASTLTQKIEDDVAAEASARAAADDDIKDYAAGLVSTEAGARADADTALGTRIDNEATARGDADTQLSSSIDGIASRLGTAEGAIQTEAGTRQQEDQNLQSQIDALSASSDVIDILNSHAELETYADTHTVRLNDVIKVLSDETQDDATTYYKWSDKLKFEYDDSTNTVTFNAGYVPTSGDTIKVEYDGSTQAEFTSDGLATYQLPTTPVDAETIVITSNVKRWEFIGSEGPYYTIAETDAKFATKQNLSDGLDTKVDVDQQLANAGKVLVVGNDGIVAPSDVATDNTTIEVNNHALRVKAGSIGDTQLAQSVKDEIDSKADAADVYTKSETYSSSEIDTILDDYVTNTELEAKGYQDAEDVQAIIDANIATKAEVLEIIANIGVEPGGATFEDGTNAVLTFEDGAVMQFDI